MAHDPAVETMAALRAVLIADEDLTALIAGRIHDRPKDNALTPYVRFGNVVADADDTDGTQGFVVAIGFEVHSRPKTGRTEALAICAAIKAALHRKPEILTVLGFTVSEMQVATYTAARQSDGETYLGTLALQVWLDLSN